MSLQKNELKNLKIELDTAYYAITKKLEALEPPKDTFSYGNWYEKIKLIKSEFNGKNGFLRSINDLIKNAPIEEKAQIGKIRIIYTQDFDSKVANFIVSAKKSIKTKENSLSKDKIITNKTKLIENIETSGIFKIKGYDHPLALVAKRFTDWLKINNYYQYNDDFITTTEYNFERLNIAKDHPAREMHDSIYIDDLRLLKTHNTSLTAKVLAQNSKKGIMEFSCFIIGEVFRNEEIDATHFNQFLQLDFFAINKKINIKNLMWTLDNLLAYVFEKKVKLRYRTSYFPFTEPSFEVDIFFNEKWLEILGAGIINQKVLEMAGYDKTIRGFAAGIGIDRVAMIKYNINDIRELYKNDIRFLMRQAVN